MPTIAEPFDKKKLAANYSVYVKVAEREFLGKNFKSALKSFKNVIISLIFLINYFAQRIGARNCKETRPCRGYDQDT